MVPIDFPNAGVLQTFNLFKKKKKGNIYKAQWNEIWDMPVIYIYLF